MISITERPKTFDEMYGNKMIVDEMRRRSQDITFPGYMLFSGPSGTGKSTTALIISKLLNCHNYIDKNNYKEPCNACKSCTDINEGKFKRDVAYFDATTMGKDNIHELSEYLAYSARYDSNKIIIIDEAHLLSSKQAKGAMLLLSEKERKNTYVMLCTTEPEKFDKALRSRYQEYTFKLAKWEDIFKYLNSVLNTLIERKYSKVEMTSEEEENFNNNISTILTYISENSGGSYRQGLQYLDKILESRIFTLEQAKEEFGFFTQSQNFHILKMLLDMKKDFIKEIIENILNEDSDLEFLYNFMYKMMLKAYAFDVSDKSLTPKGFFEKESFKIVESNNFFKLLDTLESIENKKDSLYFNKKIFIQEILKYIDKVKQLPVLQRKREKIE